MHSGKTARPDIKCTAEISKKKFKKLPVLEQILKLFYRYQPSQYFFTYSGIKLKNIFLPIFQIISFATSPEDSENLKEKYS